MGIFNMIGNISNRKNQFKLFTMLMKMGLNNPDEVTSVCATVITIIATMYELTEEDFRKILDGMLEEYNEGMNDSELQEMLEGARK